MTFDRLRESDLPCLKEIYDAQTFDYPWPDFSEPQYVERMVMRDESGQVVAAVIARQTVELFFLMDHQASTPRFRFEWFRILHERMRIALQFRGFKDAHCWLPPEIEKSFARRLTRGFGWRANRWLCLSRTTERIPNGTI